MDAKGAKWVLVSNFREIRLYAVGYGRKDFERFDLAKPFESQNYERLFLLLSPNNLLGDVTAALLDESEKREKEITDQLYAEYKRLRAQLISTITSDNSGVPLLEVINFSQTILDRILFVAFAEDKGLLPKDTLRKAYETKNPFSPQPVWENFKGLFHAIDKGSAPLNIPGYNGGLFAEDKTLNDLKVSDKLCEGFRAIGAYDFDSDVSVNILGHIFEQSITDIEEFKLTAVGAPSPAAKKNKRKKDGIYYTPSHVTRFMVEQAVGGWLNERKDEIGFVNLPALSDSDYKSIRIVRTGKRAGSVTYSENVAAHVRAWEAYKTVLTGITVLDPACGSGAFLNEVFDYLYREGQTINAQLATLHGGQFSLFRWDTHILSNN
ncbi:MAG: type I restriction endonuclease subunit M, partial [Fimbriimonadaceae bacterium]